LEVGLNLSLSTPLRFPVRIRMLDSVPKILAGGVPVTPFNLVLLQRQREKGSTPASLDTYARAARLYVEFCVHRHRSLIQISNEEFIWFKNALLGHPFPNSDGKLVRLDGARGRRTADLMLTLLYSLTVDVMERYDVSFDWLRYRGVQHYPTDPAFVAHTAFAGRHEKSWDYQMISLYSSCGLPGTAGAARLRMVMLPMQIIQKHSEVRSFIVISPCSWSCAIRAADAVRSYRSHCRILIVRSRSSISRQRGIRDRQKGACRSCCSPGSEMSSGSISRVFARS